MREYTSILSDYLETFILISAILFILVAILFTRDKFPDTIKGFFLVIVSFFYSPFVYFKHSLLTLADFKLRDESKTEGTKQYLTSRFLTSLQALLSIFIILIIVAGIIAAWEILLPPKYIREQNDWLEEQLEEFRDEYQLIQPEVEKMEKEWSEKKEGLINNYFKESDSVSNKALTENAGIEKTITNNISVLDFFNSVKNYLKQNEKKKSMDGYAKIKNEVENYIERQDLTANIKSSLMNYTENWYLVMLKRYEKNSFDDEQFRDKIQPEYVSKNNKALNLSSKIAETKNQIDKLRPKLKYEVGESILALLATFLTVIVILWLVGLALELLWLSVDIASNVNKIKNQKENNNP